MRGILLGLTIFGALAFGITEKEFKRDREYVQSVDKRLDLLDERAQREGPKTEIIDELNSYGYPLYQLKEKYLLASGEKFEKFYRKVMEVYEKLLYVKRGIFPTLLMREAKEADIPLCDVKTEGKERKTLSISIENPQDERAVLKLMTQTQLQYAQLLGIESINFKKCR